MAGRMVRVRRQASTNPADQVLGRLRPWRFFAEPVPELTRRPAGSPEDARASCPKRPFASADPAGAALEFRPGGIPTSHSPAPLRVRMLDTHAVARSLHRRPSSRRRTEPGRRTPRYAGHGRGSRRRGSSVQGPAWGQFYVPRRICHRIRRPCRSSTARSRLRELGVARHRRRAGRSDNLGTRRVRWLRRAEPRRPPRRARRRVSGGSCTASWPVPQSRGNEAVPGSHAGGDETSS